MKASGGSGSLSAIIMQVNRMSRQQTLAWQPVLFCFLQIDGHVFRFEEFKRMALLGNYCLDPRLSLVPSYYCDVMQSKLETQQSVWVQKTFATDRMYIQCSLKFLV